MARHRRLDDVVTILILRPSKSLGVGRLGLAWGINRFSVSWQIQRKHRIVDFLESWGYEVNIYEVLDLEAFLQAILLLPRSLTSDFNFPKWYYFGRGSGQNQAYFHYKFERKSS